MGQEQVYEEFLNFDWDSLANFRSGLKEILDGYLEGLQEQDPSVTAIPAVQKQQLIDQAKSFFYCSHTGNILNLDEFYAWKRSREPQKIEEVTEEPPYSSNYQELVDLIVSGKEVPGIKQIPDTVLEDKQSTSTAKPRQKPWES